LIENGKGAYSLSKDESRLVFRTTSFSADRGSVLHSGIYNREFSSVLASFALAGLTYFLLVTGFGKETAFYLVFMIVFIGAFPLFRKYLFRERYLNVVLDRTEARAEISMSWIREKMLARMPLQGITGLRIETKKTEVVNRDGVEFVEKISAMHGTVIPGFGEEKTFYSLKLGFADKTELTIFAHSSMPDVMAVYDEIKEFLKI
jgi:hypothetical protein